jgi:hypothetical protein
MALYDAMTGTGILLFVHLSKTKVRPKLIIFQMSQRLVGMAHMNKIHGVTTGSLVYWWAGCASISSIPYIK